MSDLAAQARQFAEGLTTTVYAVIGDSCVPFEAAVVGDGVAVRQEPTEGIPLSIDGEIPLQLRVSYRCGRDDSGEYLRVERSKFALHYGTEVKGAPLFRYDYNRHEPRNLPRAHLQVDESATSDLQTGEPRTSDLTAMLSMAGNATRRSRKANKKAERTEIARLQRDLRFPLGGDRFRPSMEDVLQFLIEEFGIDTVDDHWRPTLEDARLLWRGRQLRAAVRDDPQAAAEALERLQYDVKPPEGGHPQRREEDLRRL